MHTCHSSQREDQLAQYSVPVTEGQAVQALRLRLVPLQVRVQHEARVGVWVVEQQPVHLGLRSCCGTVSAACCDAHDQATGTDCRNRKHARRGLACCHSIRYTSKTQVHSIHRTTAVCTGRLAPCSPGRCIPTGSATVVCCRCKAASLPHTSLESRAPATPCYLAYVANLVG